MLSFKNVESYDDGIIDDDEFVLLFDFNTSKKPGFPYSEYDSFSLDEMDNMPSLLFKSLHIMHFCSFHTPYNST